MEGTWYLSLPALLKHVCTDNFVQDEVIFIKKMLASLGIIGVYFN